MSEVKRFICTEGMFDSAIMKEDPRGDYVKFKELAKTYLRGWEKGVTDYAVWKDGEQLVGAIQAPLKKVLKRGPM